ncbi:alpha/beta hydrolase family protein [Diplocloster hominis]|uniref:alpha/beta hydrolase n=1 Tax=Diplocloster hominis TaxID=3079010 RepID=UPI0031BBBE0F
MAYFQCNFFSSSLLQNTDIRVIIPSPDSDELMNGRDHRYFVDGSRFQVLYLLHGAYGDCTDWQRYTNIEKFAQEYQLAVVMPSADNSFYQDMAHGKNVKTYITEELPRFIEYMFPVSGKREDKFLAGLSMGGYGAYYLALSCPEQYSRAASLSGGLDLCGIRDGVAGGSIPGPFCFHDIFERPDQIMGSDADLLELYRGCRKRGCEPSLFQACGTGDFLYESNIRIRDQLLKLGAELTYLEGPGGHDWEFWGGHIRDIMEWLPLKGGAVTGESSGLTG